MEIEDEQNQFLLLDRNSFATSHSHKPFRESLQPTTFLKTPTLLEVFSKKGAL